MNTVGGYYVFYQIVVGMCNAKKRGGICSHSRSNKSWDHWSLIEGSISYSWIETLTQIIKFLIIRHARMGISVLSEGAKFLINWPVTLQPCASRYMKKFYVFFLQVNFRLLCLVCYKCAMDCCFAKIRCLVKPINDPTPFSNGFILGFQNSYSLNRVLRFPKSSILSAIS